LVGYKHRHYGHGQMPKFRHLRPPKKLGSQD
jgi:hypothetical protein